MSEETNQQTTECNKRGSQMKKEMHAMNDSQERSDISKEYEITQHETERRIEIADRALSRIRVRMVLSIIPSLWSSKVWR